jgi:phosphopantothenoylcysteine synthetase/decarboxylase
VTDFVQKQATGKLSLHRAENFSAYMDMVYTIVQPSNHIDAIILSAAVSDFGPDTITSGKISSKNAISLELSPLPKIRDRIRAINPNIVIVAFKQMPL